MTRLWPIHHISLPMVEEATPAFPAPLPRQLKKETAAKRGERFSYLFSGKKLSDP
jgi:hypothetical protein